MLALMGFSPNHLQKTFKIGKNVQIEHKIPRHPVVVGFGSFLKNMVATIFSDASYFLSVNGSL